MDQQRRDWKRYEQLDGEIEVLDQELKSCGHAVSEYRRSHQDRRGVCCYGGRLMAAINAMYADPELTCLEGQYTDTLQRWNRTLAEHGSLKEEFNTRETRHVAGIRVGR